MMYLCSFLSILSYPIITTSLVTPQKSIQVWDKCLSESTITKVAHTVANRGLGHRLFHRAPTDTSPLNFTNPIESTLHSILTELKDDSPYVEYWSRTEWKHLEVHADIDENLGRLNPDLPFRYPSNGHVLYVQVGSEVLGPTCLFPGLISGGDLVSSSSGESEIVSVPAVPSRLLRFEGNMLHTVPRPNDIWFIPFVKGIGERQPEEKWGRSVILFNTWMDEPPTDVSAEETVEGTEDREWCNTFSDWREVLIEGETCSGDVTSTTEKDESFKVWLLGDLRRRKHPMRTVKLRAPERLQGALMEKNTVSRIPFRQN